MPLKIEYAEMLALSWEHRSPSSFAPVPYAAVRPESGLCGFWTTPHPGASALADLWRCDRSEAVSWTILELPLGPGVESETPPHWKSKHEIDWGVYA